MRVTRLRASPRHGGTRPFQEYLLTVTAAGASLRGRRHSSFGRIKKEEYLKQTTNLVHTKIFREKNIFYEDYPPQGLSEARRGRWFFGF